MNILFVNACIRKESRTKRLAEQVIEKIKTAEDTVSEVYVADAVMPIKDESFRSSIADNSKKIVLGVAVSWSNLKGLKEFELLSEDPRYQVVLVGVDNETKSKLPPAIKTVAKTESQEIFLSHHH